MTRIGSECETVRGNGRRVARPFGVCKASYLRSVGAPSLRFLQGRAQCCRCHGFIMPSGLYRIYGAHHLHFITNSCYRRGPFLYSPRARDRFLAILEQTRQKYGFVVVGYVVMPEHGPERLGQPALHPIEKMVSAEGIESAGQRSFNDMQGHGWHQGT